MPYDKVSLPELTPLQVLAISVLFERELSSREIQGEMAFLGVERKMQHLYRLLGRLEMDQYVCGRYRQFQTIDGRNVRERHYRVSEKGLNVWQQAVKFYSTVPTPRDDFQPVPMSECRETE
ncbi:MAG: hypothetical protein ACYTG0_11260 [Planctomycetota bacterium]|jgi:hypothetical protein